MVEYIEREAMRDALYEADAITMSGVSIINRFPAADVRPVKRGKWTFVGYDHGLKVCECSSCKKRAYGSVKFCPNCGADMREES